MKDKFVDMINELSQYRLPDWDKLPDLDLYMDQVITYLDRELSTLTVNEEDKIITASMINNYVKGGLLPPPSQKKYNKDHLSRLLVICSVKQILSISDTRSILETQPLADRKELYEQFVKTQENSAKKICSEVMSTINNLDSNMTPDQMVDFLNLYVIKLAIDAEIKKIVAEKIINLINIHEQEITEKDKKESKKKNNE